MVCRDVESSRSDAGRAGEPSLPALTCAERMEENARETAQRDGISEGLVCVYGAMETCRTFRVQYHKNGPKVCRTGASAWSSISTGWIENSA